jgi:hypothetical protein
MHQQRVGRATDRGLAVARLSTWLAGIALVVALGVLAVQPFIANAGPAPVDLGTAASFAVLAGSTVTNTGPSVVNGDLGVSPGSAVTGFPPGTVNGTIHAGDAVAAQAQSDLTIAYNDAAGRPCDVNLTGQDLGGKTLTAGVYCFSTSAQLTGTVTLNAQGDPSAVFIFQIGSTLTTASASSVSLINGTDPCNVFWKVGSSATLGTDTTFIGNILALTSITLNTTATVSGRTLARNGAVTLDSNTITRATCTPPSGTPPSGTPPSGTPPSGTPPSGTPPSGTPPSGTPPSGTPPSTPSSGGAGSPGPGSPAPSGGLPSGGGSTGGGSTAGIEDVALLVIGGALLAMAVGGFAVTRKGSAS